MVAVYHFAFFFPTHSGSFPIYPSADWCWVGVELFFVISGFVIAFSASQKNAGEFVLSRAARLYPAAWICATITLLITGAAPLAYVGSLVLSPIGPWVSGVYWTLAVEIAFYALIALTLWRGWSIHKVALLLGWFSAGCWALRSLGIDLPVGPYGHYGCYFAFGMLLFQRRSPYAAIVFVIAGVVGAYWDADELGYGYFAPVGWLISVLIAVALVFRNEAVVKMSKTWPTRTIGLMTYPLYLVHTDVGPVFLKFGVVAALTAGLAVAFAVLPIETLIRRHLFFPLQRFVAS
jgi:peptidoglycan/LPS O-acetylase OafA/YrhL